MPLTIFKVQPGHEDVISVDKEGSSGFTLHSPISLDIPPHAHCDILFPLCVGIPAGHVGILKTVGSLSRRYALNSVDSVIHPYYRGNIHMSLINDGPDLVELRKGDPVYNLIVVPVNMNHVFI